MHAPRTAKRHHVRCRHCEARRVLRRHPDAYYRLPSCKVCGRRSYRVDRWMMQRDTWAAACKCGGYWFIHRKGSLHCWYTAAGDDKYLDTAFACH